MDPNNVFLFILFCVNTCKQWGNIIITVNIIIVVKVYIPWQPDSCDYTVDVNALC